MKPLNQEQTLRILLAKERDHYHRTGDRMNEEARRRRMEQKAKAKKYGKRR